LWPGHHPAVPLRRCTSSSLSAAARLKIFWASGTASGCHRQSDLAQTDFKACITNPGPCLRVACWRNLQGCLRSACSRVAVASRTLSDDSGGSTLRFTDDEYHLNDTTNADEASLNGYVQAGALFPMARSSSAGAVRRCRLVLGGGAASEEGHPGFSTCEWRATSSRSSRRLTPLLAATCVWFAGQTPKINGKWGFDRYI
jgi:hypothetical protein